jgi:hypothetical protein
MPFLINDANLPATVTAQPMSDDEFSDLKYVWDPLED